MYEGSYIPELKVVQSISCDEGTDLTSQLLRKVAAQEQLLRRQEQQIKLLRARMSDQQESQRKQSPRVYCLEEQIANQRTVYQQLIKKLVGEKVELLDRIIQLEKPRGSLPGGRRTQEGKENNNMMNFCKAKITTMSKRKSKPDIQKYCSN